MDENGSMMMAPLPRPRKKKLKTEPASLFKGSPSSMNIITKPKEEYGLKDNETRWTSVEYGAVREEDEEGGFTIGKIVDYSNIRKKSKILGSMAES